MMVSKVEPGSVPSIDQCPLRLISSRRGKKVVILDGYIFHLNCKNKTTAYFKCSNRTKGCNASILLRNWNHNNFTFDGYEITNGNHVNHLPDPDKIRRKEEKGNKVLPEKAQDLKAPEFLNSKHVCLFCLSSLPLNYLETTILENVVPYGEDLTVSLDNPTKNSQAFDLLCSLLNIKWRRYHEGRTFDQTITLPLCIKCQNLYQEVFQLHVQIRELEVLINKRIKVIRGIVERSAENESIGQTQLTLLGLDNFRKKVKDANFNKYGHDAEENDNDTLSVSGITAPSPPKINRTTTTVTKTEPEVDTASASVDVPTPASPTANLEMPIVKQEVNPEDEHLEDYYYEPSWMHGGEEDVDDSEDFPASPKKNVTPTPQRTRSTRVAAQRASERVAATQKYDDDEDKSGGDSDSDAKINEDDDDDSFDSESDIEFTEKKQINPAPKKKVNPSYVSSLSRSIRYRQRASTSSKPSSAYQSTKEYTCNICFTVMIGHKLFVEHFKKEHPGKKRFACKFCDRKFESFRNVSIHQRTHTGEKPFKCPHCSFATHHPKTLPSHIAHMHSDRPPETFTCPECPKKFPTKSSLHNHLVASHGKEHEQKFYRKSGKPVKTITCHLCDAKVIGQGPFAQHYAEVHPEEKKFTCKYCKAHFRYIREVLEHQRRHTGDKPFKCDQCSRAFVHERLLKSHKLFRHSERPRLYTFACTKCDKKFSCRSALTTHSYTHNETVAFCKTCGRSFRFKAQFARHNQKQHGGTAELSRPVKEPEKLESLESLGISAEVKPNLKCHVCWEPIQDKVFIQKHFDEHHPDHKGGLNTCQCGKKLKCYKHVMYHAMRHSRDRKEFQCDICPHKSFSITELNVHRASHVPVKERQKNHVCDVCGMGLVSANALHNHQKKHAKGRDEIKWVCEQCGKSYTEKRGLDHHTKTAHLKILPWKCDKCDKSFPLKSILNKHNRCHLGYKPFKCDFCEVAFIHPTSKTRHMKEVHDVQNNYKGRERKTNKRRGRGGTAAGNDGGQDDSIGSEQSSSFSGAGGMPVLPMPMNFSMYPPVSLPPPIPHPSHLISGTRGVEPELKLDRDHLTYSANMGS